MNSTEPTYTLAVLLDEVRRVERISQTSSGQLSDMDREFWVSHPLAYLGDYPRPIERVVEWLEALLGEDCGSRTVDAMMRSAAASIIDMSRDRDDATGRLMEVLEFVDRGLAALPATRTDAAHGKASVLREVRNILERPSSGCVA